MTPYYLCARIRVTNPHRLEETKSKLIELQRVTLEEPACHEFRILEDKQRLGDFLLWESWEGKAGLEAHYAAGHTRSYLAQELTEIVEITELGALEA